MQLGAWVHDIDPVIIHLWGGLAIRWYGASYVAGFALAWAAMRFLSGRGACQVPRDRIGDAVIYAALGAVVGGRLGYALIYQRPLLWTFDAHFPWWALLDLTRGGMASHGGMVGVIAAAWRISRGWRGEDRSLRGRCPPRHVMDVMALVAPLGLFLGRLANFINGELLGRIVAGPGQPAPWWAVRFPQEVVERPGESGLTPEQSRELLALVDRFTLPGEGFDRGFARMLDALRTGAPNVADPIRHQLELVISARHPSQLYQALAEGLVLGVVLWVIAHRPRLPGVTGCWFLIVYGVLRVVTEFWRLPDAHLATQRIVGLSRGQWISMIMVAAGASILAWIRSRGGQPIGGWSGRASTPA